MPANQQPSERDLWAWTALLAIVLAMLDAITPPYVNFEVLYVGLVFISLWSTRRSYTYFVAVISTCLAMQGAFVPGFGSETLWPGATSNHLLVVAVIWGAAFLCQLRQQAIATESRLHCERENALKRNEELQQTADMLREKNEQLSATRDVTVYTLAKVAESRDLDTGRHLERICAYSLILADELRKDPEFSNVIDQEFLTNLRQSSPLHDIGKVSVSDNILLKPAPLTPDEYCEMKKHAVIGSNILEDAISHKSEATFLNMAAVVARCHHERFDGQGYPQGLAGRAIPLAARIVALADVYDAITSSRPYKMACSPETARDIIVAESGKQFDPDVVEAFARRFDDYLVVQHRYCNDEGEAFGTVAESLLAEYCGAGT